MYVNQHRISEALSKELKDATKLLEGLKKEMKKCERELKESNDQETTLYTIIIILLIIIIYF